MTSSNLNQSDVLDALRQVRDPDRDDDIVSLKMVSGIVIRDGNVGFTLEIDPQRSERLEATRKAAEAAVAKLKGVLSVTAVMTAERPANQAAPRGGQSKMVLEGVKTILAVASGKGGVGKSTTSVNLAAAFSMMGLRTGLMDADIYGPSIPRMLGLSGQPEAASGDKKLMPMQAHGLACMSMGMLVAEDTPMIWRGPMVMGAIEQMLSDVDWGRLDTLVIDLPPGTGDAQLTLSQRVPLTGAVIVSTPQDIALIDARKGLNMFRKVAVPVVGLIENMSYFNCPHCGERSEIFGHGGARAEAARIGADFLGEIPLDISIRHNSDDGQPILMAEPDGPHAQRYLDIGKKIWDKLTLLSQTDHAPRIVVN